MKGSIQKRTGPQGIAYRVRVEYPPDPVSGRRRQRSESFPTKKEAERALARWVSEIDRGTAVDATKITVGELLTLWLESVARHNVRPTTYEDYEAAIRVHLVPELGSIKAKDLTASRVQAFYAAKLANGASPRTVQLCHLRLSQALKQAVRWSMLPLNVCDAAEPPKVVHKKTPRWTAEEGRRFLATAKDDTYHPLWLLALHTGMRRGEMLGLRWQDLDLPNRRVHIRQSVVVLGKKPVVQPPKSDAARRTVKLTPEVVEALAEHRKRWAERRLAAGALWEDNDLVFCTAEGRILNPANVYRNYLALIAEAKVPRTTLHGQRHNHATWLLKAGQPVKVVSERLGHAKTSITMDIYADVLPDMQDAAVDAVSDLLTARPA